MDDRRPPRYKNRDRLLSNESTSNKYRRERPNLSEKPIPIPIPIPIPVPNANPNPNSNLDLDLVKRIEFLINQDPRDLLRKLDELRDQLSRSCEISERPIERQASAPVSRRTLSSASFGRQNPGNSFQEHQVPGNHFPGNYFPPRNSRSLNQNNSVNERYRRVRIMPHDNYSPQYNTRPRENYNNHHYNHYGEFQTQPRLEEIYGFAPGKRSLLGSQNYDRRSMTGSQYSDDWASQRSESTKRRAKRSFLPLNGASPFAVCNSCYELLQIPSGFIFNRGKKMCNFKCGTCSEVISVNFQERKTGSFSAGSSQNWNYQNYDDSLDRNKVYYKDVNAVSLSTSHELEEREYGYDRSSDRELEEREYGYDRSSDPEHERDVLEGSFNSQKDRKYLVSSEELESGDEMERSSGDIKETVETEPTVSVINPDEIIGCELFIEDNKDEMERSSSINETNSTDVAFNEEINAFAEKSTGEITENMEQMMAFCIYELQGKTTGENTVNKEEMEVSSIYELQGKTTGENTVSKEEMEVSSIYELQGKTTGENTVNKEDEMEVSRIYESQGEITEENTDQMEASSVKELQGETSGGNKEEMEASSIKELQEETSEGNIENEMKRKWKLLENSFLHPGMVTEPDPNVDDSIFIENSYEMERSIKDENPEQIGRSIKDNNSETGRSIKEQSDRSIKDENSEELERSIRDDNSEEMERSSRVDSVKSNSNRGSSRSSLDEEQGAVTSKNGDSSFFGGLMKKSFKDFSLFNHSSEGSKCKVFVNGHPISERAVKRAEKKAGPIDPGNYWYDYNAGFWGVMGHECLGIIPPFIREFHYPIPRNCADGNTGVIVNGRELHRKDLDVLVRRGLPATSAKAYAIEMSGKVVDVASGRELKNLGKLAPTIEILKHGFGMLVPQDFS